MNEKDPKTYAIIGTAMEVHRVLGAGFLEAVYLEAITIEFNLRQIPSISQPSLPIAYKEQLLNIHYHPDFICFDEIIVELKASTGLTSIDEAQILNYLKASGKTIGLLINFGAKSLEYKRFILTH